MNYYITQIQENDKYKVLILTSFLYDIDRFQSVFSERQAIIQSTTSLLSSSILLPIGFKNKVYDSISINQCLSLYQYNSILNQLVNNEKRKDEFNLLVIEDLDEAYNIAAFENYITASKMITNIIRIIRKLSQQEDITCIVRFFFKLLYSINYLNFFQKQILTII